MFAGQVYCDEIVGGAFSNRIPAGFYEDLVGPIDTAAQIPAIAGLQADAIGPFSTGDHVSLYLLDCLTHNSLWIIAAKNRSHKVDVPVMKT